jgi:cell volume regulation protein A
LIACAKKLDLLLPLKKESKFNIDLPDEAGEQSEIKITEELIAEKGNTLKSLGLPQGVLVVMIKRGDKYIVPTGTVELLPGDYLLTIASSEIDC